MIKVAILGGGPGALSAAFELTATPELRKRYSVSVYTSGWRLGGKCASSRNRQFRYRNEEHGFHILGGYYDNTFDILVRLYEEWKTVSEYAFPFKSAFVAQDAVTCFERRGEEWAQTDILFPFPKDEPLPGKRPASLSFLQVLRQLSHWAGGLLESAPALLQSLNANIRAEVVAPDLNILIHKAERLEAIFTGVTPPSDPEIREAINIAETVNNAVAVWDEAHPDHLPWSGGAIRNGDWISLINLAAVLERFLTGLNRLGFPSRG